MLRAERRGKLPLVWLLPLLLLLGGGACAPLPMTGPATPEPGPELEATVEALVEVEVQAAMTDLRAEFQAQLREAFPSPTATSPVPATPPAAAAVRGADLAGMVEQVKSGVVRIETRSGGGSGVIFETNEQGQGLVLTNYHVIHQANRIGVLVDDSRRYQAQVAGYDSVRDLAVLEICCDRFQPLAFYDSEDVRPGSEVVAIGYALGFSGSATVTRGIVSAVRYHPAYRSWVFQTDAPMNPGNSGGPLLLTTGQVIGINTFVRTQDRQGNPTEGLGFAISERSIQNILPQLKGEAQARFTPPTATPDTFPDTAGAAPPVEWQEYRSQEAGYRLSVPRDWAVSQEADGRVSFASPDGFAGAAVEWYSQSPGSVADLLDRALERRRQGYPDQFRLLARQIIVRSDNDALGYLIYQTREGADNCRQQNTEILIYQPAQSYGLLAWSCLHSYQRYQAVQETILDSFALR